MKEKDEILNQLLELKNQVNIDGMKRFGIESEKIIGISMKDLEIFKKGIGRNHDLACELWDLGYHETRMLGAMIADPKLMKSEIIDKWAADFDNWAICDSVCGKLIQKSDFAYNKVLEWNNLESLWIKRASYALMAMIAVHHKKLSDSFFDSYFDLIILHSNDERNYIKKAVNWALRQIGKRNINLGEKSLDICNIILREHPFSKSAKWIVSDAKREIIKKYGI